MKVYQRNSDKTFILKRPLQHLVLLETTIKDPANESQCCRREAAMNAGTICKLTTWFCFDPNPGGECLDYPEPLYLHNIYALNISLAKFYV